MTETTSSPQASEPQIDLLELLGLLWDSRWLIALVAVIGAGFGVLYSMSQTPIYRANSLVQVEPEQSGLLAVSQLSGLTTAGIGVGAELELLKSRTVLSEVVDELGLDVSVSFNYYPYIGKAMASRFNGATGELAKPLFGEGYAWGGEVLEVSALDVPAGYIGRPLQLISTNGGWKLWASEPGEGQPVLSGPVGERVVGNGFTLQVDQLVAHPGTRFTVVKRPKLGAIMALQGGLQISEQRRESGILRLEFEHPDPALARAILDVVGENYVRQNIKRSSAAVAQSLEFLQQTLPRVKQDLEAAERLFNDYKVREGIVDIGAEASILLSESVALEKRLEELKLQRQEIQRRFQPDHPRYQEWLFQIAELETRLGNLDGKIAVLPETQQELIRLRRDVEVGNEIYLQMLSKIQQLDIAKAGAIGNVRIVDRAVATAGPVKPRKFLMVGVAGVGGFFLGCLLVLGRAALHRGVENPDVIERMGLPVYAGIPFSKAQLDLEAKQRKKGRSRTRRGVDTTLVAMKNPADPAIEAIRSLRTSLHFGMLGADNNILMISGPSTNVGKTFLSANLAAVIAQGGQKVLLIDCDLRRGTAHRLLNAGNHKGLSSILLGQSSLAQAAVDTAVTGLSFIPRGTAPVSPSELLMSERFETLLKEAADQYDLVIVDTPPILAVTDAAIVGKHAGTTMLVTRFGVNPAKEIELTRRRFELNGIQVKGVVFNAIVKKASAYGYGSYRYYNYSYKSDNQS
ncbi:polysaccharide biosynthesis tyrosine autokinase [uncultured Marinobacter sp.]|uniref:polysaccharide biosynthesis tyrosine autokinase n=1 Tax=uncultured Marinobacter sp. TaxID=187379 RepID=UPI00258259F7|nr:polysaccharide biosynthesis tyrosine autokinase [uncultured Marinobacter sp.]